MIDFLPSSIKGSSQNSIVMIVSVLMIVVFFNGLTVIIGSVIGLFLHKNLREDIKRVVFISSGMVSVVIGMQMAFQSNRILYVVIALFLGGIIGTLADIEGWILSFGGFLEKHFTRGKEDENTFAKGFLNASVLFCVGAMTILGAFKAGAQHDYDLLLMKSIMDGFMAIMFSAAMGIGVMFSVITILVYEGGLTLLAAWLGPVLGEAGLAEISGLGGILVIMIGLNLLDLKNIKTANFLPGLIIVVLFTIVEPYLSGIMPF